MRTNGKTAGICAVTAVIAAVLGFGAAFAIDGGGDDDAPRIIAAASSGPAADARPSDAPAPDAVASDAPAVEPSVAPTPSHTDPPSKGKDPYDRVMYTTGLDAVALTFDDGPSPKWTPRVLGKLKSLGIKATFCVIGQNARDYPELIRKIVADGHTLCNHSWSHDLHLGEESAKTIREDLEKTNDAIHAAEPGADVAYFRHPGGNWTNRAIDVAESLGMTPLNWSVDPRDWEKPKSGAIVDRVLGHTGKGSIILMHDGGGDRSHTCTALDTILPELNDRYELIPLWH